MHTCAQDHARHTGWLVTHHSLYVPLPPQTMWDSFGRNIKLGCVEDQENNKQLAKLLRFASSKTDGAKNELTSLQDYVKRAKEGQARGCGVLAAC